MSYWDFSGYEPTIAAKGICAFSSCGDPTRTISLGDPAYSSRDLGVIFHENCFKQTKMYRDGYWLRGEPNPYFDEKEIAILIDEFAPEEAPKQKSFWQRHRTKIIFGLSALVAVAAIAINHLKQEEFHTVCLHSSGNIKDLFCCVKEVSADITKCTFKLFESVNIWTDAGNPTEFHFSELPATNPDPVILETWGVKGAQKLFQRIFQ